MGKQLGTNHSNANVFQTDKIPCTMMKTVYRNARWGCKHFLGIRILSRNEEPNLDASQWGRDLPHCWRTLSHTSVAQSTSVALHMLTCTAPTLPLPAAPPYPIRLLPTPHLNPPQSVFPTKSTGRTEGCPGMVV